MKMRCPTNQSWRRMKTIAIVLFFAFATCSSGYVFADNPPGEPITGDPYWVPDSSGSGGLLCTPTGSTIKCVHYASKPAS